MTDITSTRDGFRARTGDGAMKTLTLTERVAHLPRIQDTNITYVPLLEYATIRHMTGESERVAVAGRNAGHLLFAPPYRVIADEETGMPIIRTPNAVALHALRDYATEIRPRRDG
jgi:hypothetical protein